MTTNIPNVVMGVKFPDMAGSWYTLVNELMNSGDYDPAIPRMTRLSGVPRCV